MAESYDDTEDPHHVKQSNRIANTGQDHQTQSSSDCFPVTLIDQPCLPLSPSSTHASLNEGSPTTASSPSAPSFTTSDNEPRGHSLHTLRGGTPSGLQSYNAAAVSSSTEAHPANKSEVDSLIEDDVLKNTIPVVRNVLQGAVNSLDTVVKSPPQLDARGSSFNDVGRDQHQHQHYHVHVTVCPHASSGTSHHRAETPNTPNVGPEPDTFAPLLERGYKLMASARTFVATSIAAVVAQFDL